jgi:alpha-tubulin suppressor-like RCC1 family protein
MAWGDNGSGQCNVPATATNVAGIAAGSDHSVALRADGSVIAWGANNAGQCDVPFAATNVVKVACGAWHIIALRVDGTVIAWGNNVHGETVVPVSATNIVGIAGGVWHSLAVRADGAVIGWGDDYYGESDPPVAATNFVAVAAGGSYPPLFSGHSLALRADGAVFAWGNNYHGQCNVPADLTNTAAIGAGLYHSLAVIGDGASRFTSQPWDRSVCAGDTVVFSAPAVGLSPLIYQWQFNGTNIPGANNSYVILRDVQSQQAGTYAAVVSNSVGVAVSRIASLRVIPSVPVISPQPQAQTVTYPGTTVTFTSGVVNGTAPLAFQWQFNGVDVPGGTNTSLALSSVTSANAGSYHLVVSNAVGVVVSSNAFLTVLLLFPWGDGSHGQSNLPASASNVVAIAGGDYHNLALRADGAVIAWGDNSFGQCTVPTIATNVVQISGGGMHNLALLIDGTVAIWGDQYYYGVSGLSNVVEVASGADHNLALRADGTVIAWSMYGQLATPSVATDLVAIGSGTGYDVALRADGTVLAWGRNDWGQTNVPPNVTNVAAVAAGPFHTLALRGDGTVVAWGRSDYGQCNVPPDATNIVSIAAGGQHSLAVRPDGTVIAWGRNDLGECSPPPSATNIAGLFAGAYHSLALAVAGDSNDALTSRNYTLNAGTPMILAGPILAGAAYTYQWQLNGTNIPAASNAWYIVSDAQATEGGPYSLFRNGNGSSVRIFSANLVVTPIAPQITSQPTGLNLPVGSQTTLSVGVAPATEPISYQWQFNGRDIPGATTASLALTNLTTADGGVYEVIVSNQVGIVTSTNAVVAVSPVVAWGWNSWGQTNVPVSATNVIAIAGGWDHSLALRADGTVIAWGSDAIGRCDVPPNATNVVAISAGNSSSMALRGDGSLVVWGDSGQGQTNVPPSATKLVAIAGGGGQNLALRADGTVLAWGANEYGQANVPPLATNVIAIAGGEYHSLALRADGTVVVWGWGYWGETNVPVEATNVVAIAGGWGHCLALRGDGTVVGWGTLGVPAGLSNVVAIACGGWHSLALLGDRTVVAWGDNTYSQSIVPSYVTNVATIGAGRLQSLALLDQGTLGFRLYSPVERNNAFATCLTTYGGKNYSLQAKDSLSESNWLQVSPKFTGYGHPKIVVDQSPNSPQRFYRVRQW